MSQKFESPMKVAADHIDPLKIAQNKSCSCDSNWSDVIFI